MKKINEVMYHKLLIQAEEAKTQGMTKLASAILEAVGTMPEDESVHYNYQQLEDEVYQGMWKLATHVLKYYDVESADAGKMHDRLEALADKFLQEVEESLGVENVVSGPLESKLFGEDK
jgi:hypothetical protein